MVAQSGGRCIGSLPGRTSAHSWSLPNGLWAPVVGRASLKESFSAPRRATAGGWQGHRYSSEQAPPSGRMENSINAKVAKVAKVAKLVLGEKP